MAKKTEEAFQQDDFVVYPTHGVGRILGTESRQIGDTEIEMLVVRFEHDRMTLRVPMDKARSLGLRTLSSKKQTSTSSMASSSARHGRKLAQWTT